MGWDYRWINDKEPSPFWPFNLWWPRTWVKVTQNLPVHFHVHVDSEYCTWCGVDRKAEEFIGNKQTDSRVQWTGTLTVEQIDD